MVTANCFCLCLQIKYHRQVRYNIRRAYVQLNISERLNHKNICITCSSYIILFYHVHFYLLILNSYWENIIHMYMFLIYYNFETGLNRNKNTLMVYEDFV